MHIAKEDVPVELSAPGATARQLEGFGDAGPYGEMSGEWFSLAAGTDSVRVTADAERILFSPHAEHAAVLDHMAGALEGRSA